MRTCCVSSSWCKKLAEKQKHTSTRIRARAHAQHNQQQQRDKGWLENCTRLSAQWEFHRRKSAPRCHPATNGAVASTSQPKKRSNKQRMCEALCKNAFYGGMQAAIDSRQLQRRRELGGSNSLLTERSGTLEAREHNCHLISVGGRERIANTRQA